MSFTKTVGPTNIVTLSDAKKQLVVTSSDDDDYIVDLIDAAVDEAEKHTERSLRDTTVVKRMDQFPCGVIELPYGPVRSLSSLTYYDSDNTEQTLVEGTDFYLDKESHIARLVAINDWPSTYDRPNAVIVTYKAGYIDDSTDPVGVTLPSGLKMAILIMVATMYESRTDIIVGMQVNKTDVAERLLNRYKVYWYASQ